LNIVIALQNERIADIEHVHHVPCNVTGIGQHPKPPCAIAKDELHWFTGIVRNRKRMHTNIADRERLMTVDDRDPRVGAAIATRSQGAVRQQDGPIETPRTRKNSSNVIGVFVRNQHGINVGGSQAQPSQPARHLAGTKAGIDQQTGTAGFDQQGITPAPAAERSKTHLSLPA
jgi:hypothetical protein